MSTPTTLLQTPLTDLARAIDTDGLAHHEAALRDVVAAARRAGLSPVLAGVLGDPGQPDVARLRAFGLLASQLAALGTPTPTTGVDSPVAA
ncbi:MAG: hypothetical protein H0W46_06785 [Acidimicrobiia bacterium]|nr:hypothetical protein [Acidimicrobiia bacterium]